MSSYYTTAFVLLGVHGFVTIALPRVGGSLKFVSRFPRLAAGTWLTGLVVATGSLTVAFGILIVKSQGSNVTLGIGEDWQAGVAQNLLGWFALGGFGVIVFHLVAAGQWLRQNRRDEVSRLNDVLKFAQPSRLGPDVREIEMNDARFLSAVPHAGIVVVSRAVVASLDEDQVNAAIAHERAHLRYHHSHLMFVAQLAMAAAAGLHASRRFNHTVKLAIEFSADDYAVRKTSTHAILGALRAILDPGEPLARARILRLES